MHAATNPAQTLAETGHAVSHIISVATNPRSLLKVMSDYSMGFRLAVLASLGLIVFAGTALVQTLLARRRSEQGRPA